MKKIFLGCLLSIGLYDMMAHASKKHHGDREKDSHAAAAAAASPRILGMSAYDRLMGAMQDSMGPLTPYEQGEGSDAEEAHSPPPVKMDFAAPGEMKLGQIGVSVDHRGGASKAFVLGISAQTLLQLNLTGPIDLSFKLSVIDPETGFFFRTYAVKEEGKVVGSGVEHVSKLCNVSNLSFETTIDDVPGMLQGFNIPSDGTAYFHLPLECEAPYILPDSTMPQIEVSITPHGKAPLTIKHPPHPSAHPEQVTVGQPPLMVVRGKLKGRERDARALNLFHQKTGVFGAEVRFEDDHPSEITYLVNPNAEHKFAATGDQIVPSSFTPKAWIDRLKKIAQEAQREAAQTAERAAAKAAKAKPPKGGKKKPKGGKKKKGKNK